MFLTICGVYVVGISATFVSQRNRFDPVLQRYTDSREDTCNGHSHPPEHATVLLLGMLQHTKAMEAERVDRALAQQPPCMRSLGGYSVVAHCGLVSGDAPLTIGTSLRMR